MDTSSSQDYVSTGPCFQHNTEEEEEEAEEEDDDTCPRYKVGQRVFCHERKNLYESVIRKTAYKDGTWTYLVHFTGWNSRWDRWVGDCELCEPTEELRRDVAAAALEEKQVKIVKKQSVDRKKRKKRDGHQEITTSEQEPHKKQVIEPDQSWEYYCELPFTLKTVLVDEKDRIMRVSFRGPKAGVDTDFEPGQWRTARDVHNLPAEVSIKDVLTSYVRAKRKEAKTPEAGKIAEKSVKAFVNGLAKLFAAALPVCLLFHPERAQYLAVMSNPETNTLHKTEIYGCEFLLRLFVRLPVILRGVSDQASRRETGQHIADLIVFLQKNRSTFFNARYREPKLEELNDYERALMCET